MALKLPILRYLACVSLALGLNACGGGGSDGGSSNSSPDTFYGFFIDDAVEGLIVETAGGTLQTTGENGVFSFLLGEPITFRVSNVVIGSVNSGAEIITPGNFGTTSGTQVFRFLQSMDTTPGTPGIDLTGLTLPNTPINFSQQNSFFENDPAVIAALQASQAAGATGVLIDFATANANFLAATNRVINQVDFEDLVAYPVAAVGATEPCLVFFNADLSGESICRDDIASDPANAVENFSWSVVSSLVVADIDADTRVTITKNGTTGNRIHTTVGTECLTCDPNLGPVFEIELQTFHAALPINAVDFSGQTLNLSTGSGPITATFTPTTVTIDAGGGNAETANWSVNTVNNLLLLEGTGAPGATDLSFARAILIDGTVDDGRFVVLNALVDDSNNNGIAEQAEFDVNGVYESIEIQVSTP